MSPYKFFFRSDLYSHILPKGLVLSHAHFRRKKCLLTKKEKILTSDTSLSQSRRLPLLQVVSNNKSFSVGVQSPTEINAPRGCAVILRRICQLSLTRITHQVSRAFDLNYLHLISISFLYTQIFIGKMDYFCTIFIFT